MRLLLDTHVVLWAIGGSDALSSRGWEALEREGNELFVSAVSIWEIAIKHSRRKTAAEMPMSGRDVLAAARDAKFDLLAITHEHAAEVDGLPRHHGDPFDRLLVAQARCEAMHLLTHDKALAAYGELVLVV